MTDSYVMLLSKFDYAVCLAAALAYLMISQQDPVGLVTFNDKIRQSLPPRSKRTVPGNNLILSGNRQQSDHHEQHNNHMWLIEYNS